MVSVSVRTCIRVERDIYLGGGGPKRYVSDCSGRLVWVRLNYLRPVDRCTPARNADTIEDKSRH